MRSNKFGNRKMEYDGYKFDSVAEFHRYLELRERAQEGEIRDLECHPEFELFPRRRIDGKVYRRRVYKADFCYFDLGRKRTVVEDVKGLDHRTGKAVTDTAMSRLKREILLRHDGIEVDIILR